MSKKMIGSFISGVSIEKMEELGIRRLSTTKEDHERLAKGIEQIRPLVEKGIAEVREWKRNSDEAQEWFPGCISM
ncbi:MAG: hypothetical protein QME42_01335 [bacterium]|nr:hypothetical protein [bacterium]